MSRKYNKNFYKVFQKINKGFREKIRPNSFKTLDEQGQVGKAISYFFKKIIKKPMHKMNRAFVGKYYNSKYDSPYKGSVLYTMSDYLSYGILFIFISLIISLLFK